MGMVVDPSLAINRECRVLASFPFGTVLANQHKWFIKDVVVYMVEHAGCTVIRIWP